MDGVRGLRPRRDAGFSPSGETPYPSTSCPVFKVRKVVLLALGACKNENIRPKPPTFPARSSPPRSPCPATVTLHDVITLFQDFEYRHQALRCEFLLYRLCKPCKAMLGGQKDTSPPFGQRLAGRSPSAISARCLRILRPPAAPGVRHPLSAISAQCPASPVRQQRPASDRQIATAEHDDANDEQRHTCSAERNRSRDSR